MKIVTLVALLSLCSASVQAAEPQRIDVLQFGPSWLYKTEVHPSRGFIALLSPSTGWDAESAQTASRLSRDGYIVLGLDSKVYVADRKVVKDECIYPSGIIEDMSQDLQKSDDHEAFHRPMVIGLGDSGLLAAGIMMQNLPGTVRTAIAPSFCPTTPLPKPLCLGSRLTLHKKAYQLAGPDVVKPDERLYLAKDLACKSSTATWTVAAAQNAQTFIDASLLADQNRVQAEALDGLTDLPLTYLPADGNDWLVILISGDGGWRDIDRQLGENLQQDGFAVVGLDSLRYFWNEKTPQDTAVTLDRIVTQAQKSWHKRRVVLLGYSFGADVLPLTLAKMKTSAQVEFMGLLGFARYALFEITAGSFLGVGDNRYDNLQAMNELPHKVSTLCVYGSDENKEDQDADTESLCPQLHQSWVEPLAVSGGHHFDGDYDKLTKIIIERVQKIQAKDRLLIHQPRPRTTTR